MSDFNVYVLFIFRENKSKNDGICEANHTTTDGRILDNDQDHIWIRNCACAYCGWESGFSFPNNYKSNKSMWFTTAWTDQESQLKPLHLWFEGAVIKDWHLVAKLG